MCIRRILLQYRLRIVQRSPSTLIPVLLRRLAVHCIVYPRIAFLQRLPIGLHRRPELRPRRISTSVKPIIAAIHMAHIRMHILALVRTPQHNRRPLVKRLHLTVAHPHLLLQYPLPLQRLPTVVPQHLHVTVLLELLDLLLPDQTRGQCRRVVLLTGEFVGSLTQPTLLQLIPLRIGQRIHAHLQIFLSNLIFFNRYHLLPLLQLILLISQLILPPLQLDYLFLQLLLTLIHTSTQFDSFD